MLIRYLRPVIKDMSAAHDTNYLLKAEQKISHIYESLKILYIKTNSMCMEIG